MCMLELSTPHLCTCRLLCSNLSVSLAQTPPAVLGCAVPPAVQVTLCVHTASLFRPKVGSIANTTPHMCARLPHAAAGTGVGAAPFMATDAALLLLLPALALRMELHQQRACATRVRWRELQDFVVSTGAGAGAGAGSSAGTSRAAGRVCAGGLVAADALFVPMLHEVLQFLMHLLLGVMQTPQPGMSSSSSSSSGCAGTSCAGRQGSTSTTGSASSSASKDTSSSASKGTGKSASTSTEPLDCTVSPAAAATILSGLIAVLLPAATQAIMGQPASTPASNTAATGSISRSRNRNRSLAVTWVPLLLRLTGALEQAMRFEAQWGPSQPELQASHEFDEFPGLLAGFTQGPAWGATYLLLSQWSHSWYEWLKPLAAPEQTLHGTSSSSGARRPALLQWLLDNTPTRQLPAVQQRVLSVLCTAAKVCLSTEGPIQLTQVTEAYIFHTAWSVLGRLLPVNTAPTGSTTAAQTSGVGSSSQGIGVAAPATGQNPAGAASSNADAAMSWLSLLGRCFLQAS